MIQNWSLQEYRLWLTGCLAVACALLGGCANEVVLRSPRGDDSTVPSSVTDVIAESAATVAADASRGAATASLAGPVAVAFGPDGSLFICEQDRSLVRRVSPLGEIFVVAGTGDPASAVRDEVIASSSGLQLPRGIAVDGEGNLYISQVAVSHTSATVLGGKRGLDSIAPGRIGSLTAGRIRRVDARTGIITTVCGQGPLTQDGVIASATSLLDPAGLASDAVGNVYVAETGRNRVRVLQRTGSPDPAQQFIARTVLGPAGPADRPGVRTASQDDFPPFAAGGSETGAGPSLRVTAPIDVSLDTAGNLFVAEPGSRILRVDSSGNGSVFFRPAATAFRVRTVAASGNMLFAAGGGRIVSFPLATGILTDLSGGAEGFAGDGLPAAQARYTAIADLTVSLGKLFVADSGNGRIRSVLLSSLTADTEVGRLRLSPEAASEARLGTVRSMGIFAEATGTIHVADTGALRLVSSTSPALEAASYQIVRVAGDGNGGDTGDGGRADTARIGAAPSVVVARSNAPPGVTAGDIFFCDPLVHKVRVVRRSSGTLQTYAGTGAPGQSGDLGPATQARLNGPRALALDAAGNLYVADTENRAVRKVSPFGAISTVLATSPSAGFSETGLPPATSPVPGRIDLLAVSPDSSQLVTVSDGVAVRHSLDSFGRVTASASVTPLATGVSSLASDTSGRLYGSLVAPSDGSLASQVVRLGTFESSTAETVVTSSDLPASFPSIAAITVEPGGRRIWFSDGKQLAVKDLGSVFE